MNKSLKSISSTYVFKIYNNQLNLSSKMIKLAKDGKRLTSNDIARPLSDIERMFFFGSKNNVLDDLQEHRIIPVVGEGATEQVPTTIPAYLYNDKGRLAVIVNLTNHITKNKEGFYNIEPKVLFSLLQAGSVACKCYSKYQKIKLNTTVIKSGTMIYSKLFTKTLNKLFSLNTLPAKLEAAHFLSGLFFLVNVLGLDYNSPSTMQYALIACKNPTTVPARMILSQFEESDFADINTFITALSKKVSVFAGLKTSVFLDNYIQMYSPNMLLSLEFLPIFLHNMFAVVVGAYLNTQFAIEQTCGRELDILFKEFFKI